jgi:hypothetical protein
VSSVKGIRLSRGEQITLRDRWQDAATAEFALFPTKVIYERYPLNGDAVSVSGLYIWRL